MLALAGRQHGLITRTQLVDLGLTLEGVRHRLGTGRLLPIRKGVYAVGSPRIGQRGRWMAAVLACGPDAVVSHQTAAALYGIRRAIRGPIHISVPDRRRPRQPGVVVHRRARLEDEDVARYSGIPVTSIVLTLIDIATTSGREELEAAINEADKCDLIDPETLRDELTRFGRWKGAKPLREILDRHRFTLTDSELERRFFRIAQRAGRDRPLTQQYVNGFRVDFYWPDLGLVVETDGLRYHRTPAQQAADLRRDQAHMAEGLTPLRFSHAQVRFEPNYVEETLRDVVRRL